MIDGSLGGDDLKDKYVFWDIDGTLAPYRFNDHVADPEGTDNGQSLGEIENHIFLTRKPSAQMIYIVRNCGAKKNLIMGHCRVQQEIDDKQLWLDRYFPMIERSCRLLVSESSSKADCIIEYCKASLEVEGNSFRGGCPFFVNSWFCGTDYVIIGVVGGFSATHLLRTVSLHLL